MIFVTLTGIVAATCVFAALIWALYRAVVTHGNLRRIYALLALSTMLAAVAITWNFGALTLAAGITCFVTGLMAAWVEPRWTKLLPAVQIVLGALCVWAGLVVNF